MGVGEWTGDNPLAKVRALKFDEAESVPQSCVAPPMPKLAQRF
jgi:hypothetical protein